MVDDFFAELNAELAAHMSVAQKQEKLRKERARLGNSRLPTHVRQTIRDSVKEMEAEIEATRWMRVATVAMFAEQTCDGCGSKHTVFVQYMERQALVSTPSTTRWERVKTPNLRLPLETMIQPSLTHICADCAGDHGFMLQSAKPLTSVKTETSLSRTYQAEDINEQVD